MRLERESRERKFQREKILERESGKIKRKRWRGVGKEVQRERGGQREKLERRNFRERKFQREKVIKLKEKGWERQRKRFRERWGQREKVEREFQRENSRERKW